MNSWVWVKLQVFGGASLLILLSWQYLATQEKYQFTRESTILEWANGSAERYEFMVNAESLCPLPHSIDPVSSAEYKRCIVLKASPDLLYQGVSVAEVEALTSKLLIATAAIEYPPPLAWANQIIDYVGKGGETQ